MQFIFTMLIALDKLYVYNIILIELLTYLFPKNSFYFKFFIDII